MQWKNVLISTFLGARKSDLQPFLLTGSWTGLTSYPMGVRPGTQRSCVDLHSKDGPAPTEETCGLWPSALRPQTQVRGSDNKSERDFDPVR